MQQQATRIRDGRFESMICDACALVALACATMTAIPNHASAAVGVETEGVIRACGVERWAVKTGLDADARLVNQTTVTPTTIFHLRLLPAPAQIPLRHRVRPVETTVWGIDAVLVRYKQEPDSDIHLVLADSGGRTMIAEIPAPACVGSSSPFLPAERRVRAAFIVRFHPTASWQRPGVHVHVTGVGFFDFKHGQSGVAPNAIELHPVRSITWSGAAAVPAPLATPTPVASGGSFSVTASVSPNPVAYGDYPTLSAQTRAGAVCTAEVLYSTGRHPTSFSGSAQTVGDGGSVSWSWHMESRGTGGTATVTCTLGARSSTGTVTFTIG